MIDRVVSKSALDVEQALRKVELGFTKFEIHLDAKDFSSDSINIKEVANKFSTIFPDVVTVHTPLDTTLKVFGTDSVEVLRVINNREMQKCLYDTCELAQCFAQLYNHNIGVIIHLCETHYAINRWNLEPILKNFYEDILKRYPNIEFYIENITPLEKYSTGLSYFRSGTLNEPVMVARRLNSLFEDTFGVRFYTCLDTCHFLITDRISKAVNFDLKVNCEEIFALYSESCKNVHLANADEYGLESKQHGTGFQDDIVLLRYLIHLIQYYTPDANIVLEMREDDYLNPKNSMHARDYIKQNY